MRILKILMLSTALAAFGAGTVLAAPPQVAAVPGHSSKAKVTKKVTKKKVAAKKVVKTKKKKKVVKSKVKKTVKKKYTVAKAPKKKPDSENAPGSPPPGTQPN
jgi:hypothetical protein